MEVDESPKSSPSNRKGGKSKCKKNALPYVAQINTPYLDVDFKEQLENHFQENKPFNHGNGCQLHTEPFKACQLPKFIKDSKFLEGLRDELLDQIFHEKNNDLYKFQQSDDLKKMSSPHVKTLRKLFQEDLCDWMQEVTGIPLNNKVAMTCSKYEYTDVLLCHDDELDTRRIAFILYLVPPWKPDDGGALDLFDMDEHGQPRDVVFSLLPAWNTLTWFEVTEASHHQVAEVLCPEKTRLSVNGWFHGPSVPRPERYIEPALPLHPCISMEEDAFYDWINPIYLDPDVQGQIQEKFENDSEIELQGFLKDEKYSAVMKALQEERICWCHKTPPNKRNYKYADVDQLPEILQQCLNFLKSEPMFLTLSNLTGIKLHELAAVDSDSESDTGSYSGCTTSETNSHIQTGMLASIEEDEREDQTNPKRKRQKLNSECAKDEAMEAHVTEAEGKKKQTDIVSNPRCRGELRLWEHGSHTLLHDTDSEGCEFALDAMLFCGCKSWQEDYGGYISYIAKGEDEELLTVTPAENSLALVYRDKNTLRFVKYINHRINELQGSSKFYDFSVGYYE